MTRFKTISQRWKYNNIDKNEAKRRGVLRTTMNMTLKILEERRPNFISARMIDELSHYNKNKVSIVVGLVRMMLMRRRQDFFYRTSFTAWAGDTKYWMRKQRCKWRWTLNPVTVKRRRIGYQTPRRRLTQRFHTNNWHGRPRKPPLEFNIIAASEKEEP